MDKTTLRKFAFQARNKLKNGVKQKAYSYGITAEQITPITELKDGLIVNGTVMGKQELKQYNHLKNRLVYEGYEQVMDEAAYTWFNRIVALRFMEVNGYLPIRMSILSSQTLGKIEPDALTNILELSDELNLDKEVIYKLQDENKFEALYQYLLVKQSNKLGEIIPNVFDFISDDLALLLPDNLLAENSIIRDIVNMVDEEDWKDVEIVGWLYQFYISEQKDLVFANLKKNKKIGKNDIPAATQLFTPRWIVEYMVDNSLGRLWLESHPDKNLQESLAYYLEDAEQTEEVLKQLEDLKNPNLNVEEIEFLDPACGSGHILVYAFELFYKIYLSRGYSEREIPKLILENNLFGLDIDRRATQLATFAVIMKARSYDQRLFSRKFAVHIHSIEESNEITQEDIQLFAKEDKPLLQETEMLVETFKDAKLYGSIIQVPEINISKIKEQINHFKHYSEIDIFTSELVEYTLPLLEDLLNQYEILANQYEVVVANPPYMGSKGMDADLSKYVKKYYPDEKSDLFAVMMKRMEVFSLGDGFIANVTMQSWMFLYSYEKFRKSLVSNYSIVNMTHMDNMVMGIAFGTAATVFRKKINGYKGVFNYVEYEDIEDSKPVCFPIKKHRYSKQSTDIFTSIPGSPIAYWASQNSFNVFNNSIPLGEVANFRLGMAAANNDNFLRLWHEVTNENIGFGIESRNDANSSELKWFPYNKGGLFRKWYGNQEYVVNWKDDGFEIRNFKNKLGKIRSHNYNLDFIFKQGITWSALTSGDVSFRFFDRGFLFDNAGSSGFFNNINDLYTIQGFLNSNVVQIFIRFINPTLNYQPGTIASLPYLEINNDKYELKIKKKVQENINLSKDDWNSFETSWDFKSHPFLTHKDSLIESSFNSWEEFTREQFNQLKANEEELNRIFIDIYGLQDELTPEVEDKDVTIRKADKTRDVKSFLSYLVGLIFGRYSLDQEGLAYAGGEWDATSYKTYQPDADNIIPVTEKVLFDDDIINKIEELVGKIYGEETLEENLLFIAEALGKKINESATDCIRRYFIRDFYKDHLKIYKKRPIYWMFTSGKRGAFKGLIYLHRYDRDTIARIRTDYVLQQSRTLDNLITLEQHIIDDENASSQSKAASSKAIENYLKDKTEIVQYAEVLDHMAKQRIELDLDDGVKVNYGKFQNIEVVKDQAGKLIKMNLLEKI